MESKRVSRSSMRGNISPIPRFYCLGVQCATIELRLCGRTHRREPAQVRCAIAASGYSSCPDQRSVNGGGTMRLGALRLYLGKYAGAKMLVSAEVRERIATTMNSIMPIAGRWLAKD